MAGALHPGIASFIDSAILVAANVIRPVIPNTAVAAFTVAYAALVAGAVFAAAHAVRYILVVLPTTGAWLAVVTPYSLYAFWRPGRRGTPFWLWLLYVGIVLPVVPWGGIVLPIVPWGGIVLPIVPWGCAAAALVPPYLDSSVPRRHLPVYACIVFVAVLLQSFEFL
jgi:hypothetical protein